MKLHIVVPGAIFGKNEAKGWNPKRGNFYLPTPVKRWMRHVAICAQKAGEEAGWPDCFAVKEASFAVYRFNVAGDWDRGNSIIQDSLQFTRWSNPHGLERLDAPIGLVGNDKYLWQKESPPTRIDNHGPRVEIIVTLRAIHPYHIADLDRRRWYEREARRIAKAREKRALKTGKPGRKVESAAARRSRDELAAIERDRGLSLF